MNDPKIVYHYCNIETFLNILRSASIHLSDVEQSNDYSEKKWMTDKIKEKFKKIIYKNRQYINVEILKEFDKMSRYFDYNNYAYASCFSEQGDLLSQWRAYAQDGLGVAIGFSRELLEKINNNYDIKFLKVNYNSAIQNKYTELQAQKILDLFLEGDNLFHAMSEVFSNNLPNLCCYKNKAFKEEQEWRIIAPMTPMGMKKQKFNLPPFVLSEIKITSRKDKLITYSELDFTQFKDDMIQEIILGPKCKVSKKHLQQILYVLDYYSAANNIKESIATYS
jgi:hypothetical protein